MPEKASAIGTREEDDIVVIATGSVNAMGRNPRESHDRAVEGKTGLIELEKKHFPNFDQQARARGLETDEEKERLFQALLEFSGVGGVIPPEYLPDLKSAPCLRDFYRREVVHEGLPTVQAYVVMEQMRKQLQGALFNDKGKIKSDLAPSTSIDVGQGTGLSLSDIERLICDYLTADIDKLKKVCGAKWLLKTLGNMPAARIASIFGIEGSQNSSNAACASSGLSMHNIINGIRQGDSEIGFALGTEYVTGTITSTLSFWSTGALCDNWRDKRDAAHALSSFGKDHGGFVLGDGAAGVALATRRKAKELGIVPIAKVLSIASNTCQPKKYERSLAGGTITGQSRLIRRLFERIGLSASDIPGQLVHYMHATGTVSGPQTEVPAIASSPLGELAEDGRLIPAGNKPYLGHTLAASFAQNLVDLIEAMRARKVPGFPSTVEVDPELRRPDSETIGKEKVEISPKRLNAVVDSIPCQKSVECDSKIGSTVAFGFGGSNAALLLEMEE